MSDLLNQASLVMVPSGYKEDTVYSVVPSDGSGDLSFTRASNGTRINSAGLVEVVAWNAIQYSEDFANAVWGIPNGGSSVVVTSNATTAPNGTATADKIEIANGTNDRIEQVSTAPILTSGLPCTFSCYIKSVSGTGKVGIRSGQSGVSSVLSYTNEWQRLTWTFNAAATNEIPQFCNSTLVFGADSAPSFYAWGAQLNIGSTAKPYFPTTDRLNVPRLTYQNGGGGCPSLLLEKQSTNILTYSEDFTNAAWAKLDSGSGSTTPVVTANYATSPDGTQNADRLQCTLGSSGYSLIQQSPTVSGTHTGSIWVKSNTGANQNVYFRVSQNSTAYVVTPEWQRINLTEVNGDYLTIGLRDQTGYTNYSCDILIWGAQLEASSYPTSYIVSTSSSATRVADACFKTSATALIGQTEGTMFGEIQVISGVATMLGWMRKLSGGVYGDIILAYVDNNGIASAGVDVGGVNQVAIAGSTALSAGYHKIAFAYKANDFVLYVNGSQVASDTSGSVPTCDEIYIDKYIDDGDRNATKKQFVLFKTRLTNAELASLTTI